MHDLLQCVLLILQELPNHCETRIRTFNTFSASSNFTESSGRVMPYVFSALYTAESLLCKPDVPVKEEHSATQKDMMAGSPLAAI